MVGRGIAPGLAASNAVVITTDDRLARAAAVFGRLAARHGVHTRQAVLAWIAEVERTLDDILSATPLPDDHY